MSDRVARVVIASSLAMVLSAGALRSQSAPLQTPTAVAAGRVIAVLADSTVFAEGLDAGARTGTLYVTSVRHRTVFAVDASGQVRDLHLDRAPVVGAIFGVRVSADEQSLYVTTADHPASHWSSPKRSVVPALLRVRIRDGAIVARWPLPDSLARHMPGDLAIMDDGTVLVSDSFAPEFYRLDAQTNSLVAIRDSRFRNLQGIAPIRGTSEVLVADYSRGLFVANVMTGVVRKLEDAPGVSVRGIDGIVWDGTALIAVQNGVSPPRVVRVTLNADHTAIVGMQVLDQQPALADQPTIGTLLRGAFVYVANSQWDQYDDAGARRTGTSLSPTRLICVPLHDGGCPTSRP